MKRRAKGHQRFEGGAVVALLLVFVLLVAARSAHAGEREEARRHFKAGMTEIANGNYDGGIAELKQAYEILPHANVLYNIARAYAESGDLENAVVFYKRYLAENPADRDEVAAVARSLETRLAKSRTAAAAAAASVTPAPSPSPPAATESSAAAMPSSEGTPGATPPLPNAPPPRAVIPPTTPPGAEAGAVPLGQRKEENIYEERVVTASKGAQSPLDSPNSTYVITQQDIRLSGSLTIPDLLRKVPGIDFAQLTPADYNVSIRGFNGRLSNKLLVLVDGRSVYLDFLGTTFFDTLSIGVNDIERIEVVRGPGSALYGADAFAGVVNIITKPPGEGKSGASLAAGGQAGAPISTFYGSTWVSGRARDWNYRVTGIYDQMPRWTREVQEGRTDIGYFLADQNLGAKKNSLDVRFTRRVDKDVLVGVGAGLANSYRNFYGVGGYLDAATSIITGDVTGFVTSRHVNLRTYWNFQDADAGANVFYLGDPSFRTRAQQNVVDTELEYVTPLATGPILHDIHLGVGYRLKTIRWSYINTDFLTENHYALYGQDSIKLSESLEVVGSLRGDYVPYVDKVIASPRGSIIYKRTPQDSFRVTVSSAFRAPSFLESYLDFPVTTPNSGAESVAAHTDNPRCASRPERIVATEIGYQNQASDYYTIDVSAYYDRVSDLIDLESPRPITPTLLSQGAGGYNVNTGRYVGSYGGYHNDCQIYNVVGGEVGVRTFPITGLDIYGSYALNVTGHEYPVGCARPAVTDERTSHHKVQLGAQVRTKTGFDATLDFFYVSQETWAEQAINFQIRELELQAHTIPGYALVNARIGYRFLAEPIEVSISAFNLLDDLHREHPLGQRIGRKIVGNLVYRF